MTRQPSQRANTEPLAHACGLTALVLVSPQMLQVNRTCSEQIALSQDPKRAAFAGGSCSANKLTLRVRLLLRGEASSCMRSTPVEHAAENVLRQ